MEIKDRSLAAIVKWQDFDTTANLLDNKKTVLVGGCFDILHFGHLTFLKNVKRLGNFLIIALESDEFIINKKNKSPIHDQLQRAQILSFLRMVDLIILLPYFKKDEDYTGLVNKIKPKIIASSSGDDNIRNKKIQAKAIKAKFIIATTRLKQFASSKIPPFI